MARNWDDEGEYRALYLRDGNFTICILVDGDGDVLSWAHSKCNPNYDEYDGQRGDTIARRRAITNIHDNHDECSITIEGRTTEPIVGRLKVLSGFFRTRS